MVYRNEGKNAMKNENRTSELDRNSKSLGRRIKIHGKKNYEFKLKKKEKEKRWTKGSQNIPDF